MAKNQSGGQPPTKSLQNDNHLRAAVEGGKTVDDELLTSNGGLRTVNDEALNDSMEPPTGNSEPGKREQAFRFLFEQIKEPLVFCEAIFDGQGKVIDWLVGDVNPAFERLLGIAKDDALQRRASNIYGADWVMPPVLEALARAWNLGRSTQMETHFPGLGRVLGLSICAPGDRLAAIMVNEADAKEQAGDERRRHLADMNALVEVAADVLAAEFVPQLMHKVVMEAARLTGANLGMAGHRTRDGGLEVVSASGLEDSPGQPFAQPFGIENGKILLDLLADRISLRLTAGELCDRFEPGALPEGHVPLRGLLAARLVGYDGRLDGLIMVTDKAEGDFTAKDEALLSQLAGLASLAMQHIKAKNDAQQRARELEAIMESVPAAVWIAHDPECRQITGSRFAYDLLRMPCGSNLSKTAPEEERPAHFRVFKDGVELPDHELPIQLAAATGEEIRDYENTVAFEDGTFRHIFGNAAPLRNETGVVYGAVAAFVDITALKKAEEDLCRARDQLELRMQERTAELSKTHASLLCEINERQKIEHALDESELQFQMLVETMNEGLLLNDERGRVTYVNGNICDMLGYRREAMLGTAVADYFDESSRSLFEDSVVRQKRGDRPSFEGQLLTRQGQKLPAIISVAPVFDGEGGYRGAIKVITDISVLKQAEQERRLYMTRLEQSNRELQDFAFVASHDLQEPLRKIRTFGDRLQSKYGTVLGEEGSDYVERMRNAARRMQTLIEELLSYSRVTTCPHPFVRVDLTQVVRETVHDLEARLEEVQGEVEIGSLVTVEADPNQMRQLFQNLIGNSLKYHGPERPAVKVYGRYIPVLQTVASALKREWYQVIVEDNGIGFEEKYLERIFAPFQRLHGRSRYEGTGMGLAICRKIVERHGGSITAKSRPGNGASFIVTLPVQQHTGEDRV